MTIIRSLRDISIDKLADNFDHLWTYSKDNQNKIVWCDPGLGLPGDVSEKLLYKLNEQRKLNNGTLSLFQPENTCLRHVTIPDALDISKKGLETLESHRLLSLNICTSRLTLIDILECLGPQNLTSLKNLRCKRVRWTELCQDSSSSFFPRLDSVSCLSLVQVGLRDSCLDVIASNVPNLQSLDISQNLKITNISPLQKHAEQLQVLIMYGLERLTEVATVDTLRKLKYLQHLDVSLFECAGRYTFRRRSLLMDPSINPNLTSLDLSGIEGVTEEMLGTFLDAHPSLSFLCLVSNRACDSPMFDVKSPQYRPGIKVAGYSNLDQTALLLRRYHKSRHVYCSIVFYMLNDLDLSSQTTDNDNIIGAILEYTSVRRSFEDWYIGEAELCLKCLEKILRFRCVSHIQSDTVQQLLRACRLVLKQCEAMSPNRDERSLKEDCQRKASNIIGMCENMKTGRW